MTHYATTPHITSSTHWYAKATKRPTTWIFLSKLEVSQDYTFLTLATEEARVSILEPNLLYNHEKLKVSVAYDHDVSNPSDLYINTTLIVNNLPQKVSQVVIVKTIKKLFGEDSIVEVSFGYTSKHKEDGHKYGQVYNSITIHRFKWKWFKPIY